MKTSNRWIAVLALALFTRANTLASTPLGSPDAKMADVLYTNLGAEPASLHPLKANEAVSNEVTGYILESLANRNVDTYEWEPALASSWETAKDGKSYTFKLRQGVKWSDGQPLTAEDVKFSFEAISDPKMEAAALIPYYEAIEKAEILDPQTIKFTVKEKYFKNFEMVAGLTVIPKHIYGDLNTKLNLNQNVIGTGPYTLDKWEKGQRIVLKRNPNYWGWAQPENKGRYNFERMMMRFVKEQNVSLEMLKKGDIDYDSFNPETYVQRAVGKEWGSKVFKVKTKNNAPKGYGFIAWNLKNPLFQDRDVRYALALLANRGEMIKKFRFDMSELATGPWYLHSEYASKKVKPILFDPKAALALFKKAGWSDSDKNGTLDKMIGGKKVEMSFTVMTANPDFEKYLTLYKEDAKQVGVNIEVKKTEWNSFVKQLDERNFEAINLGWGAGSVDLDPKQIWHSDSAKGTGSNFISYNNKEVDKLIDQARGTLDKKARIPLLQKVFELVANDAPYVFLFNDSNTLYGHTARMKRVKDTYGYGVGFDYWWSATK